MGRISDDNGIVPEVSREAPRPIGGVQTPGGGGGGGPRAEQHNAVDWEIGLITLLKWCHAKETALAANIGELLMVFNEQLTFR